MAIKSTKKSVKRYKLVARNHFSDEELGIFLFDEEEGKGFEEKAHCSTIDKFTTQYNNGEEIIKEFNDSSMNKGVQLNSYFGLIRLYPSDLLLVHNQKGEVAENPIYSLYKEITTIPLTDFAYCDTNSKEFNNFVCNYFQHLRNQGFCYEVVNSEYYNNNSAFRNALIGYSEHIDCEKNRNIIVKQLGGYAMMRKAYQDIIRFDKLNKR